MARFGLKNDIFEGTIQIRYKMGSESQFIYCYQLISTPGHPNGSEKHGVGELCVGGVQINHTWPVAYSSFVFFLCHCLQKVKVYQQTKFRRDISIGGI